MLAPSRELNLAFVQIVVMDTLYKEKPFARFFVLETIARVPYFGVFFAVRTTPPTSLLFATRELNGASTPLSQRTRPSFTFTRRWGRVPVVLDTNDHRFDSSRCNRRP